jgi:hypothetical protein
MGAAALPYSGVHVAGDGFVKGEALPPAKAVQARKREPRPKRSRPEAAAPL